MTARPTIALAMIVRDEAEVIERCLGSVRELIDTWTIVDTGSDDGTPELIEAALAGVPGQLHHRPWRDFGHNRTELMALAAGTANYLLLIDADMTVEQLGPLPELSADIYLLRHAGYLDYAIPRLVRGDRAWPFVGATHEYLAFGDADSQAELPELVIKHHADGGTRHEKLERDARLLEAELERDPENERATFYLAQTRKDAGQREAAIELYRRRIGLGGFGEEAYYAAYQVAMLTAETDPDAGIGLLQEAHELRPTRAEPLHQIAYLHRVASRPEAAYAAAKRGLEIPYPEDDRLFVHRDTYEWGLLFELSITAWGAGEREEGLAACEEILRRPGVPHQIAEATARNRDVYVGEGARRPQEEAVQLTAIAPGMREALIDIDVEPDWPAFNPSIAADGEGFRAIVRTANYTMDEHGAYHMLEGDGAIRTLNYVAELDPDLGMREVEPVVDESDGPPVHPSSVQGYEDCRLFQVGGRWHALAAVRDRNPHWTCEQILLDLDGPRITAARLLASPNPQQHEKNWMPFVVGDQLRLVYSAGPTVILDCDVASGALSERSRHDVPGWTRGLRGGSQGLEVEGGHLFVVHEVAAGGPAARTYTHRFILIDAEGKLARATAPFTFTGALIEHCSGLARCGDQLVLSYGVWDRSARLALIDEVDALAALRPVEDELP